MTRLLLVDDHDLIRRGLRDALGDHGLEVVGEAGDWTGLEPLLGTAFDVLLLDIHLPGVSGLDILSLLKARPQPPRTLVVSMYPEDPYALKALAAGALGYVNKSDSTALLVEAVRTVAQGRKYISSTVASLLADRLGAAPPRELPHERLSARELQLLQLLVAGHKLPEIAEALQLAPKAVGVYRARLMEKMRMSNTAELAHYAAQHGLMPEHAAQAG